MAKIIRSGGKTIRNLNDIPDVDVTSGATGDVLTLSGDTWIASGVTGGGPTYWSKSGDTIYPTLGEPIDLNNEDIENVNVIHFNIGLTGHTHHEGSIHWDDDDKTLNVDTEVSETAIQVGQEIVLRATNKTGSELYDGKVVYVSGAQGNRPTIELADSSSTGEQDKTIGVVTADINNNNTGYVTTFGLVRDINTSGFTDGDILYLSSTIPGDIINVRPDAPDYPTKVGYCVTANPTEGIIFVNIQRGIRTKTIADIQDGDVTTDKHVMIYNSGTTLFEKRILNLNDLSGLTISNPQTNDIILNSGGTWTAVSGPETFVPRSLVNGSFAETFNATVTGGTLHIEQSGGGDLTMQFSDGNWTLDCTPPQEMVIVYGTNSSPESNYTYVPISTKTITNSTTGWPSEEHIKVTYTLVPGSAYTINEGVYINQNWNDHLSSTNGQGHLLHMAQRSRVFGAVWFSGCDGAGGDDYTTSSGGSVTIQIGPGVIYQMHTHNFTAKDTSTGDDIHIANYFGDSYYETSNLYDITTDANGNSIGNNKFFNIVLWGVANKGGTYSPLMVNMPTGLYSNLTDAQTDALGYDVLSLPREFNKESSTGFLICRLTFKKTVTTWEYQSTVDLRGTQASVVTGGGPGGTTTTFSDSNFRIYENTDITRQIAFEVSGITASTTRILTIQDKDITVAGLDDILTGISGTTYDDWGLDYGKTDGTTGTTELPFITGGTYSGDTITLGVNNELESDISITGITSGGATVFTETTSNSTSGSISSSASTEVTIGCSGSSFIIDAILIMCTTSGEDVDTDIDIEIYQKDGQTLSAADTTHDIQSAYNLIYFENGITLHNTQIDGTEAAGQSVITVNDTTNFVKYDILYFNEDSDNWYWIESNDSTTQITIYDDLVAEKTDNTDIFQVYEKKNLGMFYNKSVENNLYITITNNSVAARTFTVYAKITRLV